MFPWEKGKGNYLSKQLKNFNYKRKISISLFVRYSEINDCLLVVSIDKNGKSLFWTGDEICNKYKNTDRWNRITINKELPANIDTLAQIGVYVWLPSADNPAKIQTDNFKIDFK